MKYEIIKDQQELDKLVDHDVYLRVDGWYQSHYGTDFGSWEDSVKEVKPKVKTVTVFE